MDKEVYKPRNKIRVVTATSLFDGHDAAINIMRRILQASGAEVIHLGHNRPAAEIVDCAVQENVQAIAVTSYQGGHTEFFKYLLDLLGERGARHIKVFGGGGGTILPEEVEVLHGCGIARIYTPDDGRKMGLQGMVNDLLRQCDFPVRTGLKGHLKTLSVNEPGEVARAITLAENCPEKIEKLLYPLRAHLNEKAIPVLGITGTGGSGKSSLTDELVRRYLQDFPGRTLAILSVDPTKRKTGGALLADRIRMNAIQDKRVYMRSLATRRRSGALSGHIREAIAICKLAGYDLIMVETSGIGQSDTEIIEHSDLSLYVMTPEYGAATQLEKIDMLDYADLVAINKFDKKGAPDALRDVKKQYKRNSGLWDALEEELPVFGTVASRFNDAGLNHLYLELLQKLTRKTGLSFPSQLRLNTDTGQEKTPVIPPGRVRYLAEIVERSKEYDRWAAEQCTIAEQLYQLKGTVALASEQENSGAGKDLKDRLEKWYAETEKKLHPDCKALLESWPQVKRSYREQEFVYQVRGREHRQPLFSRSLAGLSLPKIALPAYQAWGDILRWLLQENVPGKFPYTSGVFPMKRVEEDPIRMFAGEGGPERTNKRFHYLSQGQSAQRLSTAFDSVTLYGEDPCLRPDIYGKIGNSGVSVATLDDCKKLYAGFDLCKPSTSVSMTINGPAPMLLGFFLNTAIDQQCEKYIRENGLLAETGKKIEALYRDKEALRPFYHAGLNGQDTETAPDILLLGVTGDQVLEPEVYERIKAFTLSTVRGTVQADILKEDQAQNTCIFSTEFALRMMGDVQEYFTRQHVNNFYSVSISGYHIAEAGANPVTQLALTLANGFTYVEYYLSRGMHIDDFAPNLSFFFSNGLDPEYSVIGRVARRIWAKAIRYKYQGNERSQKLKYHIQTSGRSLHAQEIEFNDIRTTLQALYAIYDNCNSLHTNAYDEAITTPTEASVRRAMAIQLIINRELGMAKNENPLQGSFIIEELTGLVEEAVYAEFMRLTDRGGVLGAMETMYQRSKIQEESLQYESLKHNGHYPIVGVNTFLSSKGSPTILPTEVIRATEAEKQFQVRALETFHKKNADTIPAKLRELQQAALESRNLFQQLMEACKVCSLGQITHALYEVGGRYRRNM